MFISAQLLNIANAIHDSEKDKIKIQSVREVTNKSVNIISDYIFDLLYKKYPELKST